MKVYIANFGRENYEWPNCLSQSTVTTMNAEAVHPFWVKRDREGYIEYCLRHLTTAAGIKPTRPVASRWFNLVTIISETAGDFWVHREKNQLWWTRSKSDAPTIVPGIDPTMAGNPKVYVCHKPCEPWSNFTKSGNRLEWNGLHARAKEFLFTEGTLQQLADDNAAYALAMIEGDDLSPWHNRPDWKAKAASAKTKPVTIYNAKQRAVVRMALGVFQITQYANGQEVLRTVKNKDVAFSQPELERYINALIEAQEGLCALTGIKLQYDGECEDQELLCSLDRIDSDGHYEAGNLQVVCRFANRWKNNGKDEEFRRLIGVVRSSDVPAV
jgi:hypothetical protein